MSTELTRIEPEPLSLERVEQLTLNELVRFEPQTWEQMALLAGKLLHSGLLPRAIANPQQAMVVMKAGQEYGFKTMQSFAGIYVVDGKTTLSGAAMVALALKHPACKYIKPMTNLKQPGLWQGWTTMRKEWEGLEPYQEVFTLDQATVAGLAGKDVWKKYPQNMLANRAAANLVRKVYPDVLFGAYTPEELDLDERDIFISQDEVQNVLDKDDTE
jgi:hypothetical protein